MFSTGRPRRRTARWPWTRATMEGCITRSTDLDAPDRARDALSAADRYQQIAEGASHAVHMPSHIYMQLGRWDDVIRGNRAALEASRAWVESTGRTRAELDRHAVDFLVYALLQQGRESDVRSLLDEAREDRATFDTGALRWYDALWSARYAAEVGSRAAVPLPRSGYRSVGEVVGLGLHAHASGDREQVADLLAEARAERDRGVTWRIAALMLEAVLDGGPDAVPMLENAIALQSEMVRPNETPELIKPPEELLGEILLGLNRPAEARTAFEAAGRRWPGRLATHLGLARAAVALGAQEDAQRHYGEVLRQLDRADPRHPATAEARAWVP